ncbi:polysaccharide deacetylase family protein [Jiangella mangrovi]|uniref:Peptidoglycan/xylan/chitin deacetylase (PgdA/CDA1 family) n=1 Tax=Jiangella mangrovi TaxID=1524084 RepID=A0A7W9GS16_9ACTN|nr:peptidoglycan/xylan/chitin deacetylase (PgdA/CDA1 family) [Jiangella mangrovi]
MTGTPHDTGWPDGHRAAVVFNVAYELWPDGVAPGFSPMGNPLPPGAFDTQAADWASYGWKQGIWRILDVLARHDVRATVFTSARAAEVAPDTVRAIVDGGHDLCAHSYTQDVLPVLLDEDAEREHIALCTALLEPFTGAPIEGWLSPRCTPSVNTRRLLAEAGFGWHGDCFDQDLPYLDTAGDRPIVAMPMTMEVNDLPLYLRHGNPPRAYYDVFAEAFGAALDGGTGHVDVTVHPHVFGRPFGARILEEIIRLVTARDDVWVTTKSALAQRVRTGPHAAAGR